MHLTLMLDPSNTPIESDASTTELDDEVALCMRTCVARPRLLCVHICVPHCDLLRESHPSFPRPCLSAILMHPSSVLCKPRAESLPVQKTKVQRRKLQGLGVGSTRSAGCARRRPRSGSRNVRVGWHEKLETPLQGARATAGKLAT